MKRSFCTLIACALAGLFLSSCGHRSSREVWEDTKTCSRYMGKGLRSLFGHHIDSRDSANYYQAWNDQSYDYEPLAGAESYEQAELEDYGTASRESPGDPGSALPGIDGFSTPQGELAKLFKNVSFDTDEYSVIGNENLKSLRTIADYLAKHPHTYIFVEGHADERGAAAYNLALGSRRANSVRSFLIQNGVDPDQLFTLSYGKERPLAMGHDESAWLSNRRAQFKIYEK